MCLTITKIPRILTEDITVYKAVAILNDDSKYHHLNISYTKRILYIQVKLELMVTLDVKVSIQIKHHFIKEMIYMFYENIVKEKYQITKKLD